MDAEAFRFDRDALARHGDDLAGLEIVADALADNGHVDLADAALQYQVAIVVVTEIEIDLGHHPHPRRHRYLAQRLALDRAGPIHHRFGADIDDGAHGGLGQRL